MPALSASKTWPIQSKRIARGQFVAPTEMARMVASNYGWVLDEQDRVLSANRKVPIAFSLEDLAEALLDLEWIRAGRGAAFNNLVMPSKYKTSHAESGVRTALAAERNGWPAHPRANGVNHS